MSMTPREQRRFDYLTKLLSELAIPANCRNGGSKEYAFATKEAAERGMQYMREQLQLRKGRNWTYLPCRTYRCETRSCGCGAWFTTSTELR